MNGREEAEHLLVLAKRHVGSLQETVHLQGFADEDWGFLAQQTIDKLLKALWVLGGVNPPRTHALDPLLDGVPAKNGTIAVPATLLDLEDFAVQARCDAEPLALRLPACSCLTHWNNCWIRCNSSSTVSFPLATDA